MEVGLCSRDSSARWEDGRELGTRPVSKEGQAQGSGLHPNSSQLERGYGWPRLRGFRGCEGFWAELAFLTDAIPRGQRRWSPQAPGQSGSPAWEVGCRQGSTEPLRAPGPASPPAPSLCFPCRLHARFYELAPNLVPMDYRKSPIVHVPMSLIIQMPELRVLERPPLPGRAWEEPEEAGLGGWGLGECAPPDGRAAEPPRPELNPPAVPQFPHLHPE